MYDDIQLIFRKELHAYFRSKVMFLLTIIYNIMAWGVFFYFSDAKYNTAENLYQFFYIQPFLMIFIIPAISMKIWADEYKNNTLEITLSLPVKYEAIILGKFLTIWVVTGIVLVTSMPVWGVLAGMLDLANIWIFFNYMWTFLSAASLAALGMMAASICYNALGAFLCGMAFCCVAVWLPLGKWLIELMPDNLPLLGVVNMFSFMEQYVALVFGQVSFASLLYFVLLTIAALIVSDLVVKYKRN